MAKLNIIKSKHISKRAIRLDECTIGSLVKIDGEYYIYCDYEFENQRANEIAVINIETGEICFFDDATLVGVYTGIVDIEEDKFQFFQQGGQQPPFLTF